MSKAIICNECGFVGTSVTKVKGNLAIEIVLWLCFLLPGLIYSLWRMGSRYQVCPKCKSTTIIPLDSPKGKKLAGEVISPEDLTSTLSEIDKKTEADKKRFKTWVIVIAVIFGLAFLNAVI